MIAGYIGDVGSGKTASMVREAYLQHKLNNKKIISNMHLNEEYFTDYVYVTLEDFYSMIEKGENLKDCVLLLDELHIWLDSRTAMSKRNRIISYFALQTRKVNVDLLFTTQYVIQIDIRIRNLANLLIECSTTKRPPLSDDENFKQYTLNIINKRLANGRVIRKTRVFITNYVYELYDTREVISIS